jgi:hypothetical protein
MSAGELIALVGRPAQERRANPGPLEQDGNGRAERPGTDDCGATRMLTRIADGGRR